MTDFVLKSGTGKGDYARVDSENRLYVRAVTESAQLHSAEEGRAFNLNTGLITLTSGDESALMYLKNNEDGDYVLTSLAVGIGTLDAASESAVVTMVRNPTSVDFSTAIDMNQNRNFGSAVALGADVYKGAEGATITGGNDMAIFFATGGSRLFAGIDFIIPKGNSIAIKLDLNNANGGVVYCALVGHIKETV